MNIILFENSSRKNLLPLCFTRPVSLLRTGILSIYEKWGKRLKGEYSFKTEDYLQKKYPLTIKEDNFFVSSHICPTGELIREIESLKPEEGIIYKGKIIAVRLSCFESFDFPKLPDKIKLRDFTGELGLISNLWDLIEGNDRQLCLDFELITKGRKSEDISPSNYIAGKENVFLEEGVKMECATINATGGPVYLGKNSCIMEGVLIRGAFALCEGSTVKMGSKIYGATTIGPHSKVGGEVGQSIITGYSNKAHDGYLGSSVLGEWCNFGAATNVSNLKNSYDKVKLWNYAENRFVKTGLQFCGVFIGDHTKTGINTMLNTGSVVGVGCNIHGTGFPRQFVPSFSDGGASGYHVNQLKSVLKTAEVVMARRNCVFTDEDRNILESVFNQTVSYRRF